MSMSILRANQMKPYYAYIHCRPDGTPFYVGKGTWKRANAFSGRSEYHRRNVAKHGKENIVIRPYECESEQEAFLLERMLIAGLRVTGARLCNMTDGGEGVSGFVFSAESRKRMSESQKRRKPISCETRKRMSVSASKALCDPELRAMRALASTGKKHSVEARMKISEWLTGKQKPQSHRAKIAVALAIRGADKAQRQYTCLLDMRRGGV